MSQPASSLPPPEPAPPPRGRRWGRGATIALLTVGLAALLGFQVAAPNQRILQMVAAAIIGILAIRTRSFVGLLILIPLLPFPKATTYGGTTLAFVLMVFVIWLARVVLRVERFSGRSPIDLPVVLLVLAYLLSFSQIGDFTVLGLAANNFFLALVYISVCYLVIHLVHEEDQLRKVITAVMVMTVLVQLTAVFELFFPERPLIPGWIELSSAWGQEYLREGLEITNMRVGGAFGDYELLAEFCAMILILEWFLLMRARNIWERSGVVALISLSVFILLATVTRGAIFSLGAAGLYLMWKTRSRIRFHTLVIAAAALVVAGSLMINLVAFHTRSGNVVDRLMETQFQGGIPDTRQGAWKSAWERVWESPILGHGPYFSHVEGVRKFSWPHNNYLFYWHIIGLVGLGAFLFLLYRLWRSTRGHQGRFGDTSFSSGLQLALRAMLLLFMIDQIKIDYIRNGIYPYWVWLFFGLIVATWQIDRRRRLSEPGAAPLVTGVRRRRLARVAALPAISHSPVGPG